MRNIAVILLAILSTLAPGCSSDKSVSTKSESVALDNIAADNQQATGLDGLVEAVRNALEKRDGDAICQLYYTENQPSDLTEIMKHEISTFVSNNRLDLNEIRVFEYADHRPKTELPGELNGKKLKFLQPPSHWIIASLKGSNGGAKATLDLTFPTREIDGMWKIMGSCYEDE